MIKTRRIFLSDGVASVASLAFCVLCWGVGAREG